MSRIALRSLALAAVILILLTRGLLSGGINFISRDCPAKHHVLMSAVI